MTSTERHFSHSWTKNPELDAWIASLVDLCQPDYVHLCTGSEEESDSLFNQMLKSGMCVKLNPSLRPNSYYFCSDPEDVARVEDRTFICTDKQIQAGPTNNWRPKSDMKKVLKNLFRGCMQGRTLYIIPYSMGPIGSDFSQVGIQITDSPYVVVNMRIMARVGKDVLKVIKDNHFVRCIHSVGMPLTKGVKDVAWPCNTKNKYIVHYPDEKEIYSFGSGYGGNALLGKKCFALRIASVMGKEEGWLAEHMLIVGVTNPQGVKKYFAAAFPSACGKTNLAMLVPTIPGWKVETVGDDIAWIKFDKEGRLRAINPEAGFFGVAPGTSVKSNPNAMACLTKNTIFTNVALTQDKDVWWEGMTEKAPEGLTTWKGEDYKEGMQAAHPNARFTTPASQCPVIDPAWEDKEGVVISAIIFGGRRSSVIPLIVESFSWQHGVFLGASISSEMTAAAAGTIGKLRHDPFSMLPFCGYNMGDYFNHWLAIGRSVSSKALPSIFYVNWFRKDNQGNWLWPGFGENSRVLKWIFERCQGKADCKETAIGYMPSKDALDIKDLNISEKAIDQLLEVDQTLFMQEAKELEEYFKLFKETFPKELKSELDAMKERLK